MQALYTVTTIYTQIPLYYHNHVSLACHDYSRFHKFILCRHNIIIIIALKIHKHALRGVDFLSGLKLCHWLSN